MHNILKKQDKKSIILNLILIFSFIVFDDANAEKSSKRNSSVKSRKESRSLSKNSITKTKNTAINEKENAEKTGEKKDTSNITKYNCEILYNKCMNEFCYKSDNGRCGCNDNKNFNAADEKCNYIYKACPNLENDIISTFKRNAKSDCSNIAINDVKNSSVSLSNVLAELKICMRPKCKSKFNEFVGCFDEDNFEKKFKACEKVYSKAQDIDLLKSMFKDDFAVYKKKYCDEIYGTIKSDGECYLTIGFGPSFKTIQKTQEFKVGDTVRCSENSFGVALEESKAQKLVHIKEIVLTGLNFLKNATAFAGTIAGATEQNSEGKLESSMGAGEILTGSLGTLGTLTGAIGGVIALKEGDFKYSGYCYVIKGTTVKELFGASDDFYYKLRWDENWNNAMFSGGDK